MSIQLETPLADALSTIVHAKITEAGWSQDDDTSLAEYIILMLVNGKTQEQIASELQSDLLPDVEGISEFAQWLLNQVEALRSGSGSAPAYSTQAQGSAPATSPNDSAQSGLATENSSDEIPAAYDADMGDLAPDNAPRGPRSLHPGRGGGRSGRGMGASNKDRSTDAALHRIRGQSGTERIGHSRGVPKGPRNIQNRDVRPGLQKALNGLTGSPSTQPIQSGMVPNGQQGQPMMSMTPQQQMEFMSMMEQQARMMAQFVQSGGNANFQQNGAQANGQGKSLFDRVESGRGRGGRGRGRGGFQSGPPRGGHSQQPAQPTENGAASEIKPEETPSSSMEVEGSSQQPAAKLNDPASTMCRFNVRCINKDCPYVHQSPAAQDGVTVDMNTTCTFGVTCKNSHCAGKHPSPALIKAHQAQEVCKFWPKCTNPSCGFKHPSQPPCRNGGDCTVEGCPFTHLQTACRFKPCLSARCPYKHEDGQRGGAAASHVWTKENGQEPQSQQHVSERKFVTEGEEELIKPESEGQGGDEATAAQPEAMIT